ncbi:MAG TPA: glycosyltransferase [Saprospiraceae bacterium]|nr:glycosyltransferase [Saprospiraceae bacterium]
MKLLIVGSQSPAAIEIYYIKYLKKAGIEVDVFEPSHFFSVTNLMEKLKFRYFSRSLFHLANKKLIDKVNEFRPGIVWIFKGLEIFPDTLMYLRKQSIYLVNYNPDHPFIRSFASNGGKNVEQCVPLYDLHFCYSRDLAFKINQEYKLKTHWLPFGYELSAEDYRKIQNTSEIHKCCFVGNPDKSRANTIKKLAANGIPIDVYGHNWNKYLDRHKNLSVFGLAMGLDYWNVLRQYRLQLNMFRPYNFNAHNMRTFEIPACGGIQLAPVSDDNEYFFNEGEEIFLYNDTGELHDKIYGALDMPLHIADGIREAARDKVISNHHSYEDRALKAADVLREI